MRSIPLFLRLTDEELRGIQSTTTLKKFKKNETILFEEDTSEFMYIILQGKVKVVRTTQDGKETILAMHLAGDFFGEMSLIDGKTAPAAVVATDDSTIMIISRENFHRMLLENKKVLMQFLHILCSRLRESWERINLLSFNDALHRIRLLFMLLADKHGSTINGGTMLDIKLTHQDIANMTGISRETVTRVIDRLQRDRVITVRKDKSIQISQDFLKKNLSL